MSERLVNRNVIVTGASSGIGRAAAVRAADEGARVVLVARDASRLEETRSSLKGDGHRAFTCDLTNDAEVAKLIEDLKGSGVKFGGVVHAAGEHWLRPLQVTETKLLNEMLASHVGSSVSLVRGLISGRLVAQEGASVVLFSSVAALEGGVGQVAYAAAKGAVISIGRSLAVELARRKVRVNVIAAGVVRTPQSAAWMSALTTEQSQAVEARHLLGLGEPKDIAAIVAFLLSEDARWITGSTIVADGGLTAH